MVIINDLLGLRWFSLLSSACSPRALLTSTAGIGEKKKKSDAAEISRSLKL